jgi:hypothetical protein
LLAKSGIRVWKERWHELIADLKERWLEAPWPLITDGTLSL